MKVLITGGAGFIASHVTDAFVAKGLEVVVVDNLSTGQKNYVHPKAKFIQADITDKSAIQEIIRQERPEVLDLHAAHIQVGNSVKNPQFDAENNIMGMLNIMEAAKEIPVKRVIFASTGGAMYGNQLTPFVETMKEEPISPYGISKRAGELYLNFYHEVYGIPYCVLRYSNVYGERQNPHGESGVVAIFMEMIHEGKRPVINGDGTHTRDYVYVGDVVDANLRALESTYIGYLNIGTGAEISTNDVFRKVVQEMGVYIEEEHGPERPGEQTQSALNAQKAKEVLGWMPTVAFDEGVKRVAQWYKSKAV